MVWWLWMLLGMALLVVEVATQGGLFALFFGLSAMVVGVLTAVGFGGEMWLQWVLFTAIAIVCLAVLRGPLKARLNVGGVSKPVDQLVGEEALATEDVP